MANELSLMVADFHYRRRCSKYSLGLLLLLAAIVCEVRPSPLLSACNGSHASAHHGAARPSPLLSACNGSHASAHHGASPPLSSPSQARGKPAKDHQRSPPPTSEHARAPYGAVCGGADDSPGAELGAELRGLGAVLGASSGGMRAREGARDGASPEPKDDDHDGAGEEQPLVRP
jgi:hypothetical protein